MTFLDTEYTKQFWSYTNKSKNCWSWLRACRPDGYGIASVGTNKSKPAHRVSWQLSYGPIPSGLCVLHSCDNPRCVRPDHLFLGTKADNNKDRDNKGRGNFIVGAKASANKRRNLKYCKYGHKFTQSNTNWFLSSAGYWCRQCCTCQTRRSREAKRRCRSLQKTKIL